MPKGFTEKEKQRIRKKLIETGREHFERFGVRKTNVGDLAREAGIAKGTFYRFFDSKEDLFLTINAEFDKKLQREAAQKLEKSQNPKETFRKFLKYVIDLLDKDPMLKLAADKEEFERLSHKIPAKEFRFHQDSTNEFFISIINKWQQQGLIRDHDPEVIVGAVKSLYFIFMHRDFIGEDIFPKVADLLIDSLVNHLVTDL